MGIPFLDGGRTREGLDCWGLVRLVMLEQTGIELPEYGDISARDLARISEAMDTGTNCKVWVPVSSPRPLDVVVMYARDNDHKRRRLHCGVMVNQRQMLHIERVTDSIIIPVTHGSVRFRLSGFYRLAGLDE